MLVRDRARPLDRAQTLGRAQTLDDILPLDADAVGVLAESTRYQGEWGGNDLYIATDAHGALVVISIPIDAPENWTAVSA